MLYMGMMGISSSSGSTLYSAAKNPEPVSPVNLITYFLPIRPVVRSQRSRDSGNVILNALVDEGADVGHCFVVYHRLCTRPQLLLELGVDAYRSMTTLALRPKSGCQIPLQALMIPRTDPTEV